MFEIMTWARCPLCGSVFPNGETGIPCPMITVDRIDGRNMAVQCRGKLVGWMEPVHGGAHFPPPSLTTVAKAEAAAPLPAAAATPLDAIRAARGATYGPPDRSAWAVGRAWRGVLEAHYQQDLPGDIPPHVVMLMHAAMKCVRAAYPFKFNGDNHDDIKVYVDLAKETDPRSRGDQDEN